MNKGFTLVELLIVIAIVGILSSTIFVSLGTSRDKAIDVKIVSSVRQLKVQLETDYLNTAYADLMPQADNSANLSNTSPGYTGITNLANDVGARNGHAQVTDISGVGNVDLFSNGTDFQIGPSSDPTFLDTGLVIFTTNTSGLATDYAIYATTSTGYVCSDSNGMFKQPGEGIIADSHILNIPMVNGRVVCQ